MGQSILADVAGFATHGHDADFPVDVIAKSCDETTMRSPFIHPSSNHFQGGKGLGFRNLINLMPPHRRYVETHVGGGAVLRKKRAASETIGIDRDPRVIAMWKRRAIPPNTRIILGDAAELVPALAISSDDLVYCDPPYPVSCRRGGRPYGVEMSDCEHYELLNVLRSCGGMVMVSSYDNPIYREMLADWERVSFVTQTHRGPATEVVWMNFKAGSELHDYRYVGDDFREREQFRRKRTSLSRRLLMADEKVLNAVLADVAESRPEPIRAAASRSV